MLELAWAVPVGWLSAQRTQLPREAAQEEARDPETLAVPGHYAPPALAATALDANHIWSARRPLLAGIARAGVEEAKASECDWAFSSVGGTGPPPSFGAGLSSTLVEYLQGP